MIGNHYSWALENTPDLATEVSQGLDRSQTAGLAATWLERAAEGALGINAPETASTLLRRCLALTPSEELFDRGRRLLRLGEAQRRSGVLKEAMQSFESAADAARRLRDGGTLAKAACGYYEDALFSSRLPREPQDDPSVRLLEQTLRTLDEDDSAVRARVLAALGRALSYTGVIGEGRARSLQSIEMARRVGDLAALAYALLAVRAGWMSPEHLAERLAGVTEMVEAAGQAGRRDRSPPWGCGQV